MSYEYTLYCDECGKEISDDENYFGIEIVKHDPGMKFDYDILVDIDLCPKCYECVMTQLVGEVLHAHQED
jgi:hypothetical protein